MRLLVSLVVSLVLICSPVWSAESKVSEDEKILVTRVQHNFDETLDIIRHVLYQNGFTVAHIQRCDGGLKEMGYETDKYRVVFFGRLPEVREISQSHAELIPFLPFKILIYAEGKESVVSILNPESLIPMVKDKSLTSRFETWKKEFVQILQQAQVAE